MINNALTTFQREVGINFQLYNSLFTALPFHRIEKTGILLSLLSSNCEESYKKGHSPVQILSSFFEKHTIAEKEQDRTDLLFRFIQYVERQVVLFDAIEEAAFKKVNDINGVGTLKQIESDVIHDGRQEELIEKLKDFSTQLVLTAHPTQFYPGTVLGIIHDLRKALADNNTSVVNTYLQQLGKTPFLQKQKPTPYDEATSLIWFLENVFYQSVGNIVAQLESNFSDIDIAANPIVKMGFWPGGDRDGNPFVTNEMTIRVAGALRASILKCYYLEVRKLRRRLTFKKVEQLMGELELKLYNNVFIPGMKTGLSQKEILATLATVREIVIMENNGLFLSMIDELITKIKVFGLYFANLDIRQDSSVHSAIFETFEGSILPDNYTILTEKEKINAILNITEQGNGELLENAVQKDTLLLPGTIKAIQEQNGEFGCNRYIISHCTSALNVMEVYGLFLLNGYRQEEITIDIVPLFETIEDLQHAAAIMNALYNNPVYKGHLSRRGRKQTIMLGFSDGTKDGGYLMANWSIYKAKEKLSLVSKENDVDVVFFDGRGGPPARGGGKTHKFYNSLGNRIANKEIQLTIQGQTISSNFGNIPAAQYNIEQLLNAGLSNHLISQNNRNFTEEEEALIVFLSQIAQDKYLALRNHPHLTDYLVHASPLRFYGDTNIGSRPAKRGTTSSLKLEDLRAIPYVGAWSQLKQNVTGFYGVGTALETAEKEGRWQDVKTLYKKSMFFKTLLDNCEMSLSKSFLSLTTYLNDHAVFGEIWQQINEEYERTKRYILKLSGASDLMADYPVDKLSIQMRERIVLPLLTIQQYSLARIREMDEQHENNPLKEVYEKLVMRCSFGIINAGRNSA